MEKFNLEEHWDKFVSDKLVVNCPTQELANQFCDYCGKHGIQWNSEQIDNYWWSYEELTCYRHNRMLYFADMKYYINKNFKIVDFQGFNNTYEHILKSKPPLGVIPKNIYELQRVQDLCRALYEYSTYEEVDIELMIKWSEELNDRLYGLKGDLE